jgi:hypothetical protein
MRSVEELNWQEIHSSLNEKGFARVPGALSKSECIELQQLYTDDNLYRSVIDMKRYRFGKGEYKYFRYPLPPLIQKLRSGYFPKLSEIANEWMKLLGIEIEFPGSHNEMLERCRLSNQHRPTPLILKYETGGFNTLHQDLYGEVWFPFQIVFALSQHGVDFTGGEFVLTEQVPRAQSIAKVITLDQGNAMIFTTNFRPAQSSKGYYRATLKHGVSEITSGVRYALGIIFHDGI